MNERLPITDAMLEDVARRMYERISPQAKQKPWDGAYMTQTTIERYRDAAHSVLLLAWEYWAE